MPNSLQSQLSAIRVLINNMTVEDGCIVVRIPLSAIQMDATKLVEAAKEGSATISNVTPLVATAGK